MTYLGLIHGAKAIQYFVRSQGIFPAPAAWSEIRMVAQEVRVLTPALLGGKPVEANVSDASVCANANANTSGCASDVVVKAWVDRDGSIVVIAANTATVSGPVCYVEFVVDVAQIGSCTVEAMFDAGGISTTAAVSQTSITFSDSLRNFATSAYRVTCNKTDSVSGNMVYNGGYEIEMNPGVPDGNYLGNYVAGGEYRDPGGYLTIFLIRWVLLW